MFKSKVSDVIRALAATLCCLAAATAVGQSNPASSREQVDKLVAVLKSDAPLKDKADACRELARVGTAEAIAPLAALLGDEQLSHMARYGLETIPDPAVDTVLREALGRLRGRPLVGVIGSLGVRRDFVAVAPLTRLLGDENSDVVQAAARALGQIATPDAAKALQAAWPGVLPVNQLALAEGLLRCAEAFTAEGQAPQARDVYDLLRASQVPHQVRTAALRGAILTRGEKGLPLLIEALRTGDLALSGAAVRVAMEMPGHEVTTALAAELESLPIERRILVINALGKRGDVQALPVLLDAARQGDEPVRLAAIRALPEIGDADAGAPLLELVGGADRAVAQAAQEAVAALPGKRIDNLVLDGLASSEPSRRITAIELVARRRMTGAVPELISAAKGADAQVRTAALEKLGSLAGRRDLPALLGLLAGAKESKDLEGAEQALTAVCINLKNSNADAGVDDIAAAQAQAPAAQKCALVRVLAAAGGARALTSVRAAVQDPDSDVHAAAIRALAGWNSAEAAPDLLDLVRTAGNATDKLLCLRGYLGFASHAETADAERLTMCRQAAGLVQNADQKKLLLAALGGIASEESLVLIQPYLDDASVRDEAGGAVVAISARLLEAKDAQKHAGKLIEPLEKAAQAIGNADLAARAKTLLEQARSKAGTQ